MRYNCKDAATWLYVTKILAYYRGRLRHHQFAHICAFYAAQLEG